MNTLPNVLHAALLCSMVPASSLYAPLYSSFFDFDELEQQIDQHIQESMRHMRKHFKQLSQQPNWPAPHTLNIGIDTSDNMVTITADSIESEKLEAHLNDANNQLLISSPTKKIIIIAHQNILSVQAQTHVEKKENKETAAKDQEKAIQFSETSIYRTDLSVSGQLLLEKQSMDYDPTTKQLIIKIPLAQSNKGKAVQINTLAPRETEQSKKSPQTDRTAEK